MSSTHGGKTKLLFTDFHLIEIFFVMIKVHRDLKYVEEREREISFDLTQKGSDRFRPENLLLDDASHVKIADFGKG